MKLTSAFILMTLEAFAVPQGINYDESQVPSYILPDPLTLNDGTKVADAKMWQGWRRAEVLKLFEDHVYGRTPGNKLKETAWGAR